MLATAHHALDRQDSHSNRQAMIVFITWLWGNKYDMADVYKLFAGVRRNMRKPFRFMVMMERQAKHRQLLVGMERHAIKDPELLERRGCLARLRMFDPGWQHNRELAPSDKLVCLDLDDIITGPIDALFEGDASFAILQGANAVNPCPYTGAIMMLRPGSHTDVWSDFSLEALDKIPCHEFPDDQGWIHSKIPNAPAWRAGSSGIYAFCKPGWPGWPSKLAPHELPGDARIVCFTGWRKPKKFAELAWVKANWRYP
jgi:hypothetical protein